MALIGKEIADEHNVPVRMSVEIFLDRHNREKATRKFLRIGLCCKVRPMKQVGTAAPITSWTAFQNESTSFAACRCSSGFSNVGSTVDSGLAVALDRRFIPHACLRKPQLFIATRKQIDWAGILPRTKHEERKNTT